MCVCVCICRGSVSDEWEEQRSNYERYRFLVLNQFKRVSEHDVLAAIEVNEMYLIPGRPSSSSFIREKAKSQAKAAIGYRYDNDSEECVSEDEQARRDEQLLTDYLRDDEEDEGDKSEEEYGEGERGRKREGGRGRKTHCIYMYVVTAVPRHRISK